METEDVMKSFKYERLKSDPTAYMLMYYSNDQQLIIVPKLFESPRAAYERVIDLCKEFGSSITWNADDDSPLLTGTFDNGATMTIMPLDIRDVIRARLH